MNTSAHQQQPLSLPESKEKLLAAVEGLDYAQRIHYAARLGRDHKVPHPLLSCLVSLCVYGFPTGVPLPLQDSPKLKELVNSLLLHPSPDAPQMEVEEEFVKILPAQVILSPLLLFSSPPLFYCSSKQEDSKRMWESTTMRISWP